MRILVTGASGFIGSRVASLAVARGHEVVGTFATRPFSLPGVTPRALELRDDDAVRALVEDLRPDAVVHLAALAKPDACRAEPVLALDVNVRSLDVLLPAVVARDAYFLFASTDLVFDGEAPPYADFAETSPIGVYGQSKALAERRVIFTDGLRGSIARVALTYGRGKAGADSFAADWLARLRSGEPVRAFTDEARAAIYVEDVAAALLDLCEGDSGGIYHVAGPETVTRYEIGLALADVFGLPPSLVVGTRAAEAELPEPRPRDVTLDIARTREAIAFAPATLREGLRRMAEEEVS